MLQIITIQLGQYYIGFDMKKVVKVLAAQWLIELNEKPRFVEGLLDFYGEIIAVVNMHERLGIPSANEMELTDKLVVIETGLRKIAFRAEDVLDVNLQPGKLTTDVQDICPGVGFISILKSGEQLIYVYDTETLLRSDELISIENTIKNYHAKHRI